jgi:hypothetical protein
MSHFVIDSESDDLPAWFLYLREVSLSNLQHSLNCTLMINGLKNLVNSGKRNAGHSCESSLASATQMVTSLHKEARKLTSTERELTEKALKPVSRGFFRYLNRHPLTKIHDNMESVVTKKILEHVEWVH